VIHEAFMTGVPVVAARTGGVPELRDRWRQRLLFESASAADLARVIRRFVDRPQLATELAAAAPSIKSVEANAREWDELYAGVLRAKAEPA
jgi:glycosyltransferase involved in cell wall biosynthesis